jgi:hypothetical protein
MNDFLDAPGERLKEGLVDRGAQKKMKIVRVIRRFATRVGHWLVVSRHIFYCASITLSW